MPHDLRSLDFVAPELVLGLVYAVGTDASAVQQTLENRLGLFRYTPNCMRLSDYLTKLDLAMSFPDEPHY